MANVPVVAQGVLNRVRCSVIVPGNPALNITAPFMGRSFAKIEFEGDFVQQIETGTGAVRSPEPFVMATISVGLLRTQSLASAWMAQAQTNGGLGDVTIHSDTAAFQPITVNETVIRHLDPGAFDGTDPIVRLTLRGTFPLNSDMWSFA